MGFAVNTAWLSTLARKDSLNVQYIKIKRILYDAMPNECRRAKVWLTNIRSREHVKPLEIFIIKDLSLHTHRRNFAS